MKLSEFIMVFFLEIYKLFFLFFTTLIWWINLVLGFAFKVIFRRRIFRIDVKNFILDGSRWKYCRVITVVWLHPFLISHLYQTFFSSVKNIISCFLWQLKFIGWRINHNFVLSVMICFYQLLKFFFFLLFTSLIPLLLKYFQLVG